MHHGINCGLLSSGGPVIALCLGLLTHLLPRSGLCLLVLLVRFLLFFLLLLICFSSAIAAAAFFLLCLGPST